MPRPPRASGSDSAWLQMGRPVNRSVVHGMVVVAGTPRLDDLRERVAEQWVRPHPRLREVGVPPRSGWGASRWTPSPPDLTQHVQERPPAEDDAALRDALDELVAAGLRPGLPRWRVDLLHGLRPETPGGPQRSVLHVAVQHGVADGVSLAHLFEALADRDEGLPVVPSRSPSGPRTDLGVLGRQLGAHRDRLTAVLADRRSPTGAVELRATARAMGRAARELAVPPRAPADALTGPLGPVKLLRWTRAVDLGAVRALGREHGGTVNDALGAVVAGAVRDHLGPDRLPAGPVRAAVPVSLRRRDRPVSASLGNQFGNVFPRLPVDEPDLGARVRAVHAEMAVVRRHQVALLSFAGVALTGWGPAAASRAVVDRYTRAASLVFSNVTGPARPLTLLGQPVLDTLFWTPGSGAIGTGVSAMSCAGRVRLGLVADPRQLGGAAEVDRLAAHLDRALAGVGDPG